MAKLEAVIFDFDGTIADSFDIFLETLQEILKRPEPLSDKEVQELRGLTAKEIIKRLNVKKWQLPILAIRGRRMVATKMDRVKIFPGMEGVIAELGMQKLPIYLLSTNSQGAIEGFLKRYKLAGNFKSIYAGTSIFGKAQKLAILLKKQQLKAEDCVYIGDETRDIEAAHKVGLRSIAVAWGYSSSAALKNYEPDKFVSEPRDLIKAINSLNN